MRVNHNISALNTWRSLYARDNRLSKSMERLSSGFRINRASDDAAGLAISEKMQGQVRGLNQAIRNAQEGISLMQTAEGALNETHSLLQRMRELAVQAGNDTLTAVDRMNIQEEMDQLIGEIDRIAHTTEFNTKKLLDGSTSALTSTDRMETRVFVRDGLQLEGDGGQRNVEEGNYRLEIEANPGTGQIQKTSIFKSKGLGNTVEVEGEDGSAITGEEQVINLAGSTEGTFELSIQDNHITVAHDASAQEIEEAINDDLGLTEDVSVQRQGDSIVINFDPADGATGITFDGANLIKEVTAGLEITQPYLEAGVDHEARVTEITGTVEVSEGFLQGIPDTSFEYDLIYEEEEPASVRLSEYIGNELIISYTGLDAGTANGITVNMYPLGTPGAVWEMGHIDIGLAPEITYTAADIQELINNATYRDDPSDIPVEFPDAFIVEATGEDAFEFEDDSEIEGPSGRFGEDGMTGISARWNAIGIWDYNYGSHVPGQFGETGTVEYEGLTAHLSQLTNMSPGDTITVRSGLTDGRGEVQTLSLAGAEQGTFTIEDGSGTTEELNWDVDAVTLRNAIASLGGIEHDVTVEGGGGFFTISFSEDEGNSGLTISQQDLTRSPQATMDRTAEYTEAQNEVQNIGLRNITGGTFTLTFTTAEVQTLNLETPSSGTYTLGHGEETITLQHNANALAVRDALTGLYGEGNVQVVTTEDGFDITFLNQTQESGLVFNGAGLEDAHGARLIEHTAFATDTTDSLAYDATAGEIEEALQALSTIGPDNVRVTGLAGAWQVEFLGDLAEQNVSRLSINDEQLERQLTSDHRVHWGTQLHNIDRFWDANGNFLLEDPQTITLVQGDGRKATFTLFENDTIEDVVEKIHAAIGNESADPSSGQGLGQGALVSDEAQFAYYVSEAVEGGTYDTVEGTIVINSAIAGQQGEIQFVGDEDIIKALGLTTIREAEENQFTVHVYNAHNDTAVAEHVQSTGNRLIGTVHNNIDVEFDPMANVAVTWQEGVLENKKGGNAFNFEGEEGTYDTFVHLADNTMVFHIGANPLQNVTAGIGDMRAWALGIHNVQVADQTSANRSLQQIDNAIGTVSAQRSQIGALQNRLEHSISNLQVAAENLTAAESRIRDVDMAAEMMEFTRNQILMQAATAMLAQANLRPQSVLQLLG